MKLTYNRCGRSLRAAIVGIVTVMAMATAVTSCRTGRSGTSSAGSTIPVAPPSPSEVPVTPVSGSEAFSAMQASYRSWQQVRIPVRVNLLEPKRLSASGTVEMVADRSILISVRMLGMELAYVSVTTDTLLVVDKMNRRYLCEDLRSAFGSADVTIGDIQSLLLGRVFLLGSRSGNEPQLTWEQGTDGVTAIQPQSGIKGVEYAFVINPNLTLRHSIIDIAGKAMLTGSYASPEITRAGPMATQTELTGTTAANDKSVSCRIEWNYDKAKWDGEFEPRRATLPTGMTRINGRELIKKLADS